MKKILFASFCISILFQYASFHSLPAIVAVQFNWDGFAYAAMYKMHYMVYSTIALVCNSGISLFADRIFKRVPNRFLSFPYGNYWLSSNRKDEAFRKMTRFTDFFGILVNLFLLTIYFLIYQANTLSPPQINMTASCISLSVFTLVIIIWLRILYIHFKPPV